jgi:polysaccharide export outer membrane protein
VVLVAGAAGLLADGRGQNSQGVKTAPAGAAAAPAGRPAPTAHLPSDYLIGPEDVIEIAVWKNDALTRTVPVRPDGKISLPLLNDVQAGNLTPEEFRAALIKSYTTFVPQPEVSVIVKEVHSIKVSIVGMVKTPGRYELKSRATVLEALALAGGLTDFAKRDRIFILRRRDAGTVRIPFNYSRLLESAEESNIFLEPGDIVVVP